MAPHVRDAGGPAPGSADRCCAGPRRAAAGRRRAGSCRPTRSGRRAGRACRAGRARQSVEPAAPVTPAPASRRRVAHRSDRRRRPRRADQRGADDRGASRSRRAPSGRCVARTGRRVERSPPPRTASAPRTARTARTVPRRRRRARPRSSAASSRAGRTCRCTSCAAASRSTAADDDVSRIQLDPGCIFVGLPAREGQLLGELLRAGEIGYELSLDPRTPIVIGVYPMRPVPRP